MLVKKLILRRFDQVVTDIRFYTTRNSVFGDELNSSQIACFSSQIVLVIKRVTKLFPQQMVVTKSPLMTKLLFRRL